MKTWQQDWLSEHDAILKENQEFFTVTSWRASLGTRRLKNVSTFLGESETQMLAQELGAYEIEDQLVLQLDRMGAKVSESGEIELLSPNRWNLESDESFEPATVALNWQQRWLAEGKVLLALVLEREEKKRFIDFLERMNASVTSPWDLWEYGEHFFLGEKDKLKVIIETRKRV